LHITRASIGFFACLAMALMLARVAAAQELLPAAEPDFESLASDAFIHEAMAPEVDEPFVEEPLPEWDRWRARLGVLLLNRTSPSSMAFSALLYGNTFNASDFNFPLSASPDISLRRLGARYDLDFRYFGVQNSIAQLTPRSAQLPWYTTPTTYTASGASKSTLQSAELNLRWAAGPNIAQLVGVRYLQFRENMSIAGETDTGLTQWIDSYNTNGRNEMFGVQIGNEIRWLYYGRFQLQSDIKVGIFGNASSASQIISDQRTGPSFDISYDYSREAQRAALSFAGDINLTATYQIRRNLALRGGYQVLVLTGVANAPAQADSYYWWPTSVDTSGTVVYHGAMAGLEWSW
jgi:hypothetical protein